MDSPTIGRHTVTATPDPPLPDPSHLNCLHQAPPDQAPPDRRLAALGTVVVLGTSISVLTATSVNIAFRALGAHFEAPISTLQWVLTGYLLAFASIIPVTGWAIDRFGARRVWIGALLTFMAGATLSGAAWSVESLVAFRILQGVGGGLIIPTGQAILARAAGPRRMGRTMSLISMPLLLATAGPVLGGLIVSVAGWRWIFYLNLPIAVPALLAAHRLLPRDTARSAGRLDLRGLALLCGGVPIFIYGMSRAGTDGLTGPHTLIGMGAGAALVALYAVHARGRGEDALIDISPFRARDFAAAAATNLAVAIARSGVIVLLPLYWQIVRGESPLAAGLLVAPQTLGAAIAMPPAGRLTDRVGAGVVVPIGLLLVLLGTGVYTQLGASAGYAVPVVALFVLGLGVGASVVPSMAAAYRALPDEAVSRGSSLLNTDLRIGNSIGTAILAIVLQHTISAEVPGLGDAVFGPLSPAAHAQLVPALAHAFSVAFWVAFALIAVALVPALLLPRGPS